MSTQFPLKFAEWIDAEGAKLLASAEDLTQYVRRPRDELPTHPDLHKVMTIDDSVLRKEPSFSEVDKLGRPLSYLFGHGTLTLGFRGDGFQRGLNISESIWKRGTVRRVSTLKQIEGWVLDWAADVIRNRQHRQLAQVIEHHLNTAVEEVTLIVPIEQLIVDDTIEFGRAKIRMLSKADMVDHFQTLPRIDDENFAKWQEHAIRQWAGHAVMEFTFVSTTDKAAELSLQLAEEYCALLQFYLPPATFGPFPSLTAPRGRLPFRSEVWMRIGYGKIGLSQSMIELPSQLALAGDYRRRVEEKLGLWTLSSLANGPACDFEERALQALLMYGRACYRTDLSDKLVQIVSAIEMLLLRDSREPLGVVGADRLAFAIGSSPNARQDIASNFRDAYALRSRRSHHGRKADYDSTVTTFLKNAWNFFLVVIRGVGVFRTREQFIDHLERRKFGFQI